MTDFWTHLAAFLFGVVAGYYIKDNLAKPDNPVNVDLTVKKNRLNSDNKKSIFKRWRERKSE